MKRATALTLTTALVASSVFAEDTRQLDAHVHGTGSLDIAFAGGTVEMAFVAPGADIVGFEYEPQSDADFAAMDEGISALTAPLSLFEFSGAAGCAVENAQAVLVSEDADDDHDHDHGDADHDEHEEDAHDHDDHDDHDHDDHDEAKDDDHDDHDHDDHKDHDHDDHAEDAAHDDHDHDDHKDHDHDDHAEDAAQDDHDHDDHKDHDHDDHADHDDHDHADEASHTEFQATYSWICADPTKIDTLSFPYFSVFPNAEKLVIQTVTSSGAQAFEATREAPTIDLSDLF